MFFFAMLLQDAGGKTLSVQTPLTINERVSTARGQRQQYSVCAAKGHDVMCLWCPV